MLHAGFSLILASAWALGCAGKVAPCASFSGCPPGQECLANRCVRAGAEPLPPATERVVLEPLEIVLVSPRSPPTANPGALLLGRQGAQPEQRVFLRFRPLLASERALSAAFLLLEPLPGTQPAQQDLALELWRVEQDWSADTISWLRQPALGPPSSRGIARSAPPSRTRIDVTQLIQYFLDQPRAQRGLALSAAHSTPLGATFASGVRGHGPQLELYLSSLAQPPKAQPR